MKLSPFTIILLGVFVLIIFLSFGWSQYKPNSDETRLLNDNTVALQAEADKKPLATKRFEHAKAAINEQAAEWRQVYLVHSPEPAVADGGIDINQNGFQLVVDSQKFRNSVQRAINFQLKKGGVKIVGVGPFVPFPPESASTILAEYYNYPGIPFPVVIFDLGTIQVQGTYSQIMEHVRSYSRMPHYLAVTDGLRLDGTSPILTGTYTLSIVGYIRGNKLFTTMPEAAAATATNQRGAGPGGPGPAGPPRGGPGGPPGPGGGMTPSLSGPTGIPGGK